MNELLLLFIFTAILNHVLSVTWNVTCKCYGTVRERVDSGNYFDAFLEDNAIKLENLLLSFRNSSADPETKILVFMKKRTVSRRCNSWLDSACKAGEWWKEVSVSLAFDFVFVYMYLRPHLSEGGYCTQSRKVLVRGSRLLIKPLPDHFTCQWGIPQEWKG